MVKEKRQKKGCKFSLYPKKFFKVFLPDKSAHCMKFPPAFLKYFNGTTPSKSIIIGPMKSSWQMDLLMINNNLYFQRGWEQFVHDNSLVFGNFLLFSYDGNAIFHVKIYGPDGCEKESMCHVGESSRSSSLTLKNEISEKGGKKDPNYAKISKELGKEDRDVKCANDFESDFPFFKVVMQPTYVCNGSLNVPGTFVRRHMSRITIDKQRNITLVNSGKSWPVKVSRDRKICKGWTRFSRDNALQVGDICIFELVDSDHCIMNVSIFRCLG